MIRITILSENTATRPDLVPEDGLSVFIETDSHKILMDSGWKDHFLSNADALGVDAAAADTVILSHNHYDHGQSMPLFFDKRPDHGYRFYLSSDALWPVFHRRADGSLTSTSSGLTDGELIRRCCDRMGLSDSHVEEPLRELLRKPGKPGSVRHGRRQRHNIFIFLRKLTDFFGKHIRVARVNLFFKRLPRRNVKGLHAVKPGRVLLRRGIALSLFRHDMDKDGMADAPGLLKGLHHLFHVMAVHRP